MNHIDLRPARPVHPRPGWPQVRRSFEQRQSGIANLQMSVRFPTNHNQKFRAQVLAHVYGRRSKKLGSSNRSPARSEIR